MNRVLALVEGPTEQIFVRDVLAPKLGGRGIGLTARIVGEPGHKGGVRSWKKVQNELVRLLKEDRTRYLTTMFDYYGLPSDWPDVRTAKTKPYRDAVTEIEGAIHADIQRVIGDALRPDRFIPHIQLHEFEALLFSDTVTLAEVLLVPSVRSRLDDILTQCGEPEAINDNRESSPSKRIARAAPVYDKRLHGPIAAERIGVQRMKKACPHFSEWVARLEALRTADIA